MFPVTAKNNDENIWETLFPFLITNTVKLHFIILQACIYSALESQDELQGKHTQSHHNINELTHCGWMTILKRKTHYLKFISDLIQCILANFQ